MRGKFPICLGERFAPTRAFAAFFGKVAFDLLNNYIRVEHLFQLNLTLSRFALWSTRLPVNLTQNIAQAIVIILKQ